MKGWIVVRTQHNREAWAAENILRQFAEPYTPKYAERVKVGKHFEIRPKLVFPSYVFVHTLDGRWRFLLGTYGVSSVLLVGDKPGIVQNSEIAKLKDSEDDDGLVILPKIDQHEGHFKKGDKVRVKAGKFSGYVGIHDGCGPKDRERILMDYLGRKTPVLIASTHIEADV